MMKQNEIDVVTRTMIENDNLKKDLRAMMYILSMKTLDTQEEEIMNDIRQRIRGEE